MISLDGDMERLFAVLNVSEADGRGVTVARCQRAGARQINEIADVANDEVPMEIEVAVSPAPAGPANGPSRLAHCPELRHDARVITRRRAVKLIGTTGAGLILGCRSNRAPRRRAVGNRAAPNVSRAAHRTSVAAVESLRTPWQTADPFLFCAYHLDEYPRGNQHLGPAASLEGHQLGRDFAGVDGWRMYHGQNVPGFPRHPHRGFETVTVVRQGLLDHADSLGATARYGNGDVQWLTAGGGIEHAEMFPLLSSEQPNPFELFQIWLNLPSAHKLVPAHFAMLWQPTIPVIEQRDDRGRRTRITLVAGRLDEAISPGSPPNSWAAQAQHDVAIWTLELEAGARTRLPAVNAGVGRSLYFYRGDSIQLAARQIAQGHRVVLQGDDPVEIVAGASPARLLLLQGQPIGEPVARRGPFVMNSDDEIRQAYADYRGGRFGQWPWPSLEPVHSRAQGRFARRPDGRIEQPT